MNDRHTDSAAYLFDLLDAYAAANAMFALAELGIPDAIGDRRRDVREIAAATDTTPDAVHRTLRLVASHGIVDEHSPGVFSLTPAGHHLRSDHPRTVRDYFRGCTALLPSLAHAADSISTGEQTFEKVHGESLFDHLTSKPELAQVFHSGLASLSRMEVDALLPEIQVGPFDHIVDVGGGTGTLLTALLHAHPGASGVVAELPYVKNDVNEHILQEGLSKRCYYAETDFFSSVPPGADIYLLKSVVHDWPDDKAVTILRNCREAMTSGSKLLLVERVVPSGNDRHISKAYDFTMLVLLGGRERLLEEYVELATAAGLELAGTTSAGPELSVLDLRVT